MLNEPGLIFISEVPGVRVYPDHADPTRFYVTPTAPRVARDERGKAALSLLLYGKGTGPNLQLLGGQLLLTLSLALTEAERRTLTQALELSLNRDLPHGALAEQVSLLSPEWLTGSVVADPMPGLILRGHPSLLGANECLLSADLDGQQAKALQAAWKHGLPDARLTYDLTMSAAGMEHHASSVSTADTDPNTSFTGQAVQTTHTTRVYRAPLSIQGPLLIDLAELQASMQVTSF